jgi:TolB-like protein
MDKPFPAYLGDEPYIFVSYSHADAATVFPEIQYLHDQGFNIWYDEGISPGSTWRDEVALALTQCKVFIFFISPQSVESRNCLKEVNFCLSRERKMLSVHIEQTTLPVGLELSLSDMQAIMYADHSVDSHRNKLVTSLQDMLPRKIHAVELPYQSDEQKTATDGKSIAVLSLVNRNLDSELEYLSDGIAEELINGLSQLPDLRVASQMSSFRFRNQDAELAVIGKKLSVQNVLSGSIQKSGDRIRVNVRLDDIEDGSMLWSQKYDGNLEDIFALQDDVAQKVVAALKIELGSQRPDQLIDTGTKNVEAYNAFLLGRHEFEKLTAESMRQATTHFSMATKLDGEFGRAYWFEYLSYFLLVKMFGAPKDQMQPKMESAAINARNTDFVLPMPWIAVERELDVDTAPDLHMMAEEAANKILHHDPDWQGYEYWQMALCLRSAGLLHGALAYAEQYLSSTTSNLNDWNSVERYIHLLSALGFFEKAIELWNQQVSKYMDQPIAVGERALLYSRTGQYDNAERDLEELTRIFPRNFAQFYHLFWRREVDAAKAYFGWLEKRKNLPLVYKYWGAFLLGEIDKGIEYLGQSGNQGADITDVHVVLRRVIPYSTIQEIEQHPRYQELLAESGIDNAWRTKLMSLANTLTDATGIHVQLDEEY